MFSSKFSTKSFMHFLLIFVCGVKYAGPVLFFHMWLSSFSQYHLLKKLSFSLWMVLAPLSKIIWTHMWEFISGLPVLSHWSVCLSLCHYSTVLITLISLEVNFEIWKCKISNFVLFQYCFGDLESSWDSMWILVWDFLFLGKKTSLGFDRDCVESVDGFG